MTIPSLDHLFHLRDDPAAFEAERQRLIDEYISALPPNRRDGALQMQLKIDDARQRLSPAEFLQWMQVEMHEIAENVGDQLDYIKHLAQDLTKKLDPR